MKMFKKANTKESIKLEKNTKQTNNNSALTKNTIKQDKTRNSFRTQKSKLPKIQELNENSKESKSESSSDLSEKSNKDIKKKKLMTTVIKKSHTTLAFPNTEKQNGNLKKL